MNPKQRTFWILLLSCGLMVTVSAIAGWLGGGSRLHHMADFLLLGCHGIYALYIARQERAIVAKIRCTCIFSTVMTSARLIASLVPWILAGHPALLLFLLVRGALGGFFLFITALYVTSQGRSALPE